MKRVLLLILVAFIFSIGLRFSYIDNIKNIAEFRDNGEYIINTNDGYTFAKGAQEIIKNSYVSNPKRAEFDNIAIDKGLSKITAFLVKITGIKLETIMFYLSAVFSSLVVVPVILIGWSIGSLEIGFIAALLSSIAWSYYNRTMLGYYDTDMLNIVFPAFILWSLIAAFVTKKVIYILITALGIITYSWWYEASYSISFSLIAMVGLYLFSMIYIRRDYLISSKILKNSDLECNKFFYLMLFIFMLFSINNLPIILRVILIAMLFYFVVKKDELFKRYIWYIFGIGLVIFLLSGGLNPIIGKLNTYIFKNDITTLKDSLNLHFVNVFNTISEASAIPFDRVANRVSGNSIVFILSIIGYIALVVRNRYFILALPLVGLGLLAHTGGLRFTIYAIVPLALGMGYLIVTLAKYVEKSLKNRFAYYVAIALLSTLVLYPNIAHMLEYNKYIKPVFVKSEIKTLKEIKKVATPKDYILSWWDYGYPLKFYSGLNTLTDGSIHSGVDNYPISYLLVQPQDKSAKMARLAVEYHEKKFTLPDSSLDKNRTDVEYMILDNGYKSANRFLSEINKVKLPPKTRDVYLFLPDRMLRIFPVVEQFSNLNIENGKSYPRGLFMPFNSYKVGDDVVYLPYHYILDLKRGVLSRNGQNIAINKFITTSYKDGKLVKSEDIFDISSNINMIYMRDQQRFILLDDKMLNSTYVQLFILENYDSRYYKPVILTPLAKIYKEVL